MSISEEYNVIEHFTRHSKPGVPSIQLIRKVPRAVKILQRQRDERRAANGLPPKRRKNA